MTIIRIQERGREGSQFKATVIFDGETEYPITVSPVFSPQDEELMEWYFESYFREPFADSEVPEKAVKRIRNYGESLFQQIFADSEAYARYRDARDRELFLEIHGASDFHALYWETLKDPDSDHPLLFRHPLVRKPLHSQNAKAEARPSPFVNLLVVSARPGHKGESGFRTIAPPLVSQLDALRVPVKVRILRPGTYSALSKHLQRHGVGHYHAIHFDLHGSLLSYQALNEGISSGRYQAHFRYGRDDFSPYEGVRAYLFMQGGQHYPVDPVESEELAQLFLYYQIPIAILGACESDHRVGISETGIGSRLVASGVQSVLTMRYSMTVDAGVRMLAGLYRSLLEPNPFSRAVHIGRLGLYEDKKRYGYFNQPLQLEDWMLPVLYQNAEVAPEFRTLEPDEKKAFWKNRKNRHPFPVTEYGFVGRDLDTLEIEDRLLSRLNILLLRGVGGAGKTTLLNYLGAWWQKTNFVGEVFYFSYDKRVWTSSEILDRIGERLLSPDEFEGSFRSLSRGARQAMLCEELRDARHLLILDNLEAVTDTPTAEEGLSDRERKKMERFLAELLQGKTLVLIGSRNNEEWLAQSTFGNNRYELYGLDPEAASVMAQRILKKHKVERYVSDEDFHRLLSRLQGYPLVLEVILPSLEKQSPAELIQALDEESGLDKKGASSEPLIRSMEDSHAHLSQEAQTLLICLAPFSSVLNIQHAEQYRMQLTRQKALSHLPFDQWDAVIQEAEDWGLLSPHPRLSSFLELKNIFPYFLKNRLAEEGEAVRQAVENAFLHHYTELAGLMAGMMQSRDPEARQRGQRWLSLEFENMRTALKLALEHHASVLNIYGALSIYLDLIQDHERGIELGRLFFEKLDKYPKDKLYGPMGYEFAGVVDKIAKRQLLLQQYAEAERSYHRALDIWLQNKSFSSREIRQKSASLNHQLGTVAAEQHQWDQAEENFKKALDIKMEFNDRYAQASTYHQLGFVAEERRRWEEAEAYFQKALRIKQEFNDRLAQAVTFHHLGLVAQRRRKWEVAREYFEQSLAIHQEFKKEAEQAEDHEKLGLLAEEQGKSEMAQAHFQSALAMYQKLDIPRAQARIYEYLRELAEAGSDWKDAEEYLLKALRIYVQGNNQHSLHITLGNLFNLWKDHRQKELPATIADILGWEPEDVEDLFGDWAEDV